jgi:hypothetical protein
MSRPKRLCSIPNCGRPHECRGYCRRHLSRFCRYGNPLAGYRFHGEAEAWLLAHANYSGRRCLIWKWGQKDKGYASDVRLPGKPREGAHRAMCRLVHGDPPSPAHQAAHSCHNGRRGCVHPQHLSWKTDKENREERRRHDAARRRAKPPRRAAA